jgi:hypothetical protein
MFSLNETSVDCIDSVSLKPKAHIFELYDRTVTALPDPSQYLLRENTKQTMIQNWEALYSNENALKRCTRCLLPETMPYISYDEQGVCSYCRDYDTRGNYLKGEKALNEFISAFKNNSGEPDVLIGFSGGRDSAFGLEYIKNTLGLHPITFTYDWGMVNDLARRNQARVVGKLGVEHIVISADIRTKRANIRKNLKEWFQYLWLVISSSTIISIKFASKLGSSFLFFVEAMKVKKGQGFSNTVFVMLLHRVVKTRLRE